jgi:hypothetical protein
VNLPSIPLGLYRHYKGGRYLLVAVAVNHAHNGDFDAVYVSLAKGHHCTRPLHRDSRGEDSWTDDIEWADGFTRARFTLESELVASERTQLARLLPAWEAGAP